MDITLWKGIFIGILVALPTGPVGFLTLRRIYLFGLRSGIYSTLGAVATDAFYGVVVGFGLKKIAKFLIMVAPYASIAAGVILLAIGIRSYYHKLDLEHHEGENTPITDISSTALLNALNPTLIFSFTVLFTAIGMQKYVGHPREIIVFLLGIAVGSFLFWFLVWKIIDKLQKSDRSHYVQRANKFTGIALGIIGGIIIIASIIRSIF